MDPTTTTIEPRIRILPPIDHDVDLRSGPVKFKDGIVKIGKYILSTLIDLVHAVVLAVLFPFDQVKRDPKVYNAESNKIPVILVHGYLDNSSSWLFQKARLKKAGIENVYTVNLGVIPKHNIEEFTDKLQARIKQVQQQTGQNRVMLVGHSMGGLVSSHYATAMAAEDGIEVTDIVTLGSPLQGTKMHLFGPGRCARQMKYHSPFVKELSTRINDEENIQYHHFASETDIIIRPWKSAFNESRPDNNHFHHKVEMGHITYLFSKKIFSELRDIILRRDIDLLDVTRHD